MLRCLYEVSSFYYYHCCFTTVSVSSFIYIHSKTESQLKLVFFFIMPRHKIFRILKSLHFRNFHIDVIRTGAFYFFRCARKTVTPPLVRPITANQSEYFFIFHGVGGRQRPALSRAKLCHPRLDMTAGNTRTHGTYQTLFSTALTLTSFAHARYTGRQLTRLIFLKFKTYPRYINVCTFLVNKYEFILTYSGFQVFNECIYKSSN